MVRRLPVIQSTSSEDALAEQRPAWHWTAIGAGFVLTLWLPLAILALWLGRLLTSFILGSADPEALARAQTAGTGTRVALALAGVGPLFVSFAIACMAAGALVGRFGAKPGLRAATRAGAAGGAAACGLAALGGSLSPWPVALGAALLLVSGGALLARLGARIAAPKA
jgi:hypothetical protein